MESIPWYWRGSLPYAQTWREQKDHRDRIIAGQAPEAIWLLEHSPAVITTGRRQAAGLPTPEQLDKYGIELHHTERGGLATWHGPGQLMAYLLIRAQERGLGVRKMVHIIESTIIEWLQSEDIHAQRRQGLPGIWVGRDKICAIGLHFRRGVSMHGLALNLSPSFDGFGLIQPCGITDGSVTSVETITGQRRSVSDTAPEIGARLAAALSVQS